MKNAENPITPPFYHADSIALTDSEHIVLTYPPGIAVQAIDRDIAYAARFFQKTGLPLRAWANQENPTKERVAGLNTRVSFALRLGGNRDLNKTAAECVTLMNAIGEGRIPPLKLGLEATPAMENRITLDAKNPYTGQTLRDMIAGVHESVTDKGQRISIASEALKRALAARRKAQEMRLPQGKTSFNPYTGLKSRQP